MNLQVKNLWRTQREGWTETYGANCGRRKLDVEKGAAVVMH